MGAVGAEELAQYEKMEEAAAARGDGGGEKEKIFVSVRLRPLSEKEVAEGDLCDWECINDTTVIFRNNLPERPMVPTAYTFDRVFRSDCTTKQVYEEGAKDVALSVVSGVNSTIFAYGQTSSGKTYTMTGITEYTAQDIYEYIHKHEERAFVLRFSAIEIYNEAVKDLLSIDSSPLRILDDPEKGTIVEKLTEVTLRDWNHLKALISVCEAHRKIGETSLNETSSRSHQILRLTIESCAQEFLGKENSSTLVATVSFVDLAGSERASQALSVGNRLKEGCHINRSLLTLGSVIRKLSKGRTGHIPYRDSKLTRILQPSLGGNARTAIICTMSPARSHIEQSRNTLLFASCAKEVVTSAQVNVVMSDKALVRHLQRELARLESELRYPGVAPSVEALLREKDAQIKKMENHIKVLIQQRDVAESQLEDLLKEPSQTEPLNVPYVCDDLLSRSELSDTAGVSPDSASSKFVTSCNRQHLQTRDKPFPSSKHTLTHLKFIGLNGNQGKGEVGENAPENIEEICQEIHCVEVHGARRSEDLDSLLTEGSNSLQHQTIRSFDHVDRDEPHGQMDLGSLNNDPVTLEQHLQNVKKALTDLVKAYPDRSSPWSSSEDPSFRGFPYSRSRSCRSRLTNSSSWIREDSTPPNVSLREFPGRPEGFQKKLLSLNFEDGIKKQSTRGSQISEDSESLCAQKLRNPDAASGDVKRLDNYTELEKMSQVHREKELFVDQRTKWEVIEDIGADSVAKDASVEPSLGSLQSPSIWPQEFEKKQQEIIELWHECDVPLVHRTCFYMLFTGDPTDIIYVEVELRRLSFLKNNLSRGNIDKALAIGPSSTSLSSLRLLRRERGMLCKQMRKSLSAAERESIYVKWGITLDSKQRRMQLARRLWSETKDHHVKESASIVARLIGLQEQGHALKEMFGLTFSPQKSNRRSFTWKPGYGK